MFYLKSTKETKKSGEKKDVFELLPCRTSSDDLLILQQPVSAGELVSVRDILGKMASSVFHEGRSTPAV